MAALTASARQNFIACVVMLSFTILTVLTRFLIKLTHRQSLNGPDWLCLISTAFFVAYCVLIINFIFNVSIARAFDFNPALGISEISYADELIFTSGISSIKLSILWFYYNIFAVNTRLRIVIKIVGVACITWFLVAIFVLIFQCSPIDAYWEKFALPPYCLESPRVLLGYELTNLFLDVVILCVPVGVVTQLHLQTTKKITVLGIFLLGALVCIASIIRITAIWNPPDILANFNFSFTFVWSTVQLGLAIICSCLPTFGPLLPILTKSFPSIQSWYASLKMRLSNPSGMNKSSKASSSAERPWARIGGGQHNLTSRTWAENEHNNSSEVALEPMPSRRILVSHDIQVS
uniref:Decarboxylase_GME8373 n=1 Tax=Daldinia eschscholzii IFB-TL01 TaxID=1169046 RepID=A0A109WQB8_9PEZI|nr:decarboxylase_GME8373 [Daldinia eschscholzii IFB-TL01]